MGFVCCSFRNWIPKRVWLSFGLVEEFVNVETHVET